MNAIYLDWARATKIVRDNLKDISFFMKKRKISTKL